MKWCSIQEISQTVTIPAGYHLTEMVPGEIDMFIPELHAWYPDIEVGSESRFLTRCWQTHWCGDGVLHFDSEIEGQSGFG